VIHQHRTKKQGTESPENSIFTLILALILLTFNYTEAAENTASSGDSRGEILLYSYWCKFISVKKIEFYDGVIREPSVIFLQNIYLLSNIFKEITFYTSRNHENAIVTYSMRCTKDFQSVKSCLGKK